MNLETFMEEVKNNIKDYLPEEFQNAEVEITTVRKLNESYPALTIRRENETITPAINLEDCYRRSANGEELVFLMPLIAESVQHPPEEVNQSALSDYGKMKDKLIIRVSSFEKNKDLLKDVPYRKVEDLAMTVSVLVGKGNDEIGSFLVTNSLLETYGISREQLFADALAVSDKNLAPQIQPMEYLISRMIGAEIGYEPPATFEEQLKNFDLRKGMAVLTNQECVNGAAVLFYPKVLEQIGEQMQGSYFILPSSVHETILLPDDGSFHLKDLENMVRDINRSEVNPKDQLSDTVYRFDAEEKVFEKASAHAERVGVMECGVPDGPSQDVRPMPGESR